MKSALLISFPFPPIQGSSGYQRILAFSRYLADFGWKCTVLTVHPRVYLDTSKDNLALIPSRVRVMRPFALDSMRDLSFRGKYLGIFGIPDRWQSWIITGLITGIYSIVRHRHKVILSTYPIASAHCIAWLLHCLTGIPWIADFRDPMAQNTWPETERERRIYAWIERRIFRNAFAVIMTTEATKRFYQDKYPQYSCKFFNVIPNGYDESSFKGLDVKSLSRNQATIKRKIVLLHSGSLSRRDRDPTNLFIAIRALVDKGMLPNDGLIVKLRASGSNSDINDLIEEYKLAGIVTLEESVSYPEAIREMCSVDGLLLLQGETCNRQIPAKLYEYLYTRKPIFAMTHPDGDTEGLLRQIGYATIVNIDDSDSVRSGLHRYLNRIHADNLSLIPDDVVEKYSRRYGTKILAELFDNAIGS